MFFINEYIDNITVSFFDKHFSVVRTYLKKDYKDLTVKTTEKAYHIYFKHKGNTQTLFMSPIEKTFFLDDSFTAQEAIE